MQPLTLDADGWMAGVARAPCPNHSPRPAGAAGADIALAVVHGISLPPRQFGGDAVPQLFANQLDCAAHPYYARLRGAELSAHFFVRRDGDTLQFVSTRRRAYHAGESRWRGRARCNDFSIGIELEGADDIPYAAAQYAQLANLLRAIAARHPDIAVCGHCHIAPRRKTDPGAAFDWDKLFHDIGERHDGRDAA